MEKKFKAIKGTLAIWPKALQRFLALFIPLKLLRIFFSMIQNNLFMLCLHIFPYTLFFAKLTKQNQISLPWQDAKMSANCLEPKFVTVGCLKAEKFKFEHLFYDRKMLLKNLFSHSENIFQTTITSTIFELERHMTTRWKA